MIFRRLRAPMVLAAVVFALVVSSASASETVDTTLPVPQRTQADGSIWAASNCGPSAIGMVLEAYGLDIPNKKLRDRANQLLGISDPSTGTRVQDLAKVVQEQGLSVTGPYNGSKIRKWTLDEARAELRSGRPMVIQVYYPKLPNHKKNPVATDHYVVLTGTAGDDFIFNDSSDKDSPGYQQRMTAKELEAAWKASNFPFAGFSVGPGSVGESLMQAAPAATPNQTAEQGQATPEATPQQVDYPTPPEGAVPLLTGEAGDLMKRLLEGFTVLQQQTGTGQLQ